VPRIVELISTQSDRVTPDASLGEVASLMLSAKISSVIVVDQGAVLGIITERDMLRLMRRHQSPELPARAAMTSPVHSAPADRDFRQAYREAASLGIRHIVVTSETGRPLGVVSESDFRKHLGPDFFLHLNSADTLMESVFPRLPASATLDEALTAMEAIRGSCVVVVDGQQPLGIVTERDVVRLFLKGENNPTLGSVMTQPAISIREDCLLTDAAQQMLNRDIRHLTVVDAEGRVIGLLSEHTLMSPLKLGLVDDALNERQSLARSSERLQEETGRNERYQRALLDNFPFLVWLKDTESRFLTANRAFTEAAGLTNVNAIVGKTDFDFWPAELAGHYRADDAAVMATRQNKIIVEPVVVNNRTIWHETYKAPVVSDDGTLLGTVGFARDISERKNALLRLEVEHDLAQALAAGMQRDEVLGTLLKATLRFPDLDAGCIHWRQADGTYRMIAHDGLSEQFVEKITEFGPDSPLAHLAVNGGTVCNCLAPREDCADEGVFDSATMQHEGLGCLVGLPIVLAGQPVACLTLASRQETGVLPSTLRALEVLGSHFSQTLHQLAAHEEARRLQQNLSGLFDTLKDFIFILDPAGHILHYNRAVAEDLGYGPEVLKGKPIAAVHPENLQKMASEVMADVVAGRCSSYPLPIRRADGTRIMVEMRVANGYWDGRPALICTAQDISERLIAEERQQLAASVFDNAHEGIMITDPQGRILEVNTTFSELTGYSHDEAVGQTPELLKSGHHEPAFYQEMWRKIREDGYWRGEIWNRKKSGEIFVELLTISSVRNRSGEIANFVSIFSDITLIKQHQQRLEHLAHFDALTQLPNRMLLGDRMQLAMAQTERSGKMLAICYLDLDNFKPINDQFGHSAGDYLLIEVAHRLKTCVRAGDTVSRLGGDEFVLLISNLDDLHECDHAIARVSAALAQPFHISEHPVTISASLGVTLYPHDGADADTLLRHADQAMYAAKQGGRNRYHLFDPENDRRTRVRREEIGRIREGLAKSEFTLYYQPKVNMRKGSVVGAEALIRWDHPEHGLLLPEHFLPVLEGSELAIEIGDWVIQEALRQIETWHDQGLDLSISINISGDHLQHAGFSRRLAELLASHPKVAPGQLELEILETAALEDMTHVAELFAECRRLGVSFALDDFGTGYSSLTYFRRLPADVLKIDQSFIRNMLDDADDLAIVEGVIGLTQAFQRKVIAEGVETVEHGLVLLLLGCDMAQGFGIARPMPASMLPEWIEQFRPDELWSLATAFQWSREDLPMLIAEVDHGRWKKSLYSYLEDKFDTLPAPPLDHRTCRFGRWYYSPDSQRYAAVDAFQTLESLHTRLHELGGQLLHCREAGDTASIEPLKLEFEQQSAKLTDCIQQIQAEVLMNSAMKRH
jgi:diguanylate cyclase (GGDEF)-like protein/PAS domain S-box-containing protein